VTVGPDEDMRVATDRIMNAICGCVHRAREIYPQTPSNGDDGWWVRSPGGAVLRSCRLGEEM